MFVPEYHNGRHIRTRRALQGVQVEARPERQRMLERTAPTDKEHAHSCTCSEDASPCGPTSKQDEACVPSCCVHEDDRRGART